MMVGNSANNKQSGIFLPLASLPGAGPCGRADKEAYAFVDFLHEAGQSYWQILPLAPMDHEFCPYSAVSSMAIDPLYIDPEVFVRWRLLSLDEILSLSKAEGSQLQVDYTRAEELSKQLLNHAFSAFSHLSQATPFFTQFREFCLKQAYWLDDFSIYQVACEHFGSDWRQWPQLLKDKEKLHIEAFEKGNEERLFFYKFCQFAADRSWNELRQYAFSRNVKLMGDIPIYVNLKSADVWANRHFFQLDSEGSPTHVSGVPPDHMCPEGQKWWHPLYDWPVLKRANYEYWRLKLARTLELYDLVRLDHFIAFHHFYSIPYEGDAFSGSWNPGPGAEFFSCMAKELGSLPFIAEDLGSVTPEVIALRQNFAIPGMRVFVFSFDPKDFSHRPGQISADQVYFSSTHDTLTLMGWFKACEKGAECSPEAKQEWDDLRNFMQKNRRDEEGENWTIIRFMMESPAAFVMFPFADLLGQGDEGRINIPGTKERNWIYRLQKTDFSESVLKQLRGLTHANGRDKAS